MFKRYAIFFTPIGPVADLGAAWLGWDLRKAVTVPHPSYTDIDVAAVTRTPRRYGLHGTLKPPFRLSQATSVEALRSDVEALAADAAEVEIAGLAVAGMGRFLALRPISEEPDLTRLAASVVTSLDHHRAPLTEADLARRRARPLSVAQESNLERWGYPYVLDQFRFHITLTDPLRKDERETVRRALTDYLGDHLNVPFKVDALSLVGEDPAGRFHLIHRYPLGG